MAKKVHPAVQAAGAAPTPLLRRNTVASFRRWRKAHEHALAALDKLTPLLTEDLSREIAAEAAARNGHPTDPTTLAITEALRRMNAAAFVAVLDGMRARGLSERTVPRGRALELDPGKVKLTVLPHVWLGARAQEAAARTPDRKALNEYAKRLAMLARSCPLPEHAQPIAGLRADVAVLERLQAQRATSVRGGTCQAASGVITDLMTEFLTCHVLMPYYSKAQLYGLVGDLVQALSQPTCLVCSRPHRFEDWRAVKHRDAQHKRPADHRRPVVTPAAFLQTLVRDAPIAGAADYVRLLELANSTATTLAEGPPPAAQE